MGALHTQSSQSNIHGGGNVANRRLATKSKDFIRRYVNGGI